MLRIDPASDLAAIAIANPQLEPVPLAQQYPQRGDPLVSCGYGSDGRLWCNRGQALGYVTTLGSRGRETLELSGAARFGDSGGPVFNREGEMVAVLFGTNGQVVDATFCGRVRRFLAELSPRFSDRPPRPADTPPLVDAPPRKEPMPVPSPPTAPKASRPPIEPPAPSDPLDNAVDALGAAAEPWLSAKVTALLVAIGLPGGVAAVAGGAIVWLVTRRGKKQLQSELDRVRARLSSLGGAAEETDAAQPPVVERHHNRYVPYEASLLDKAWAAAHARVGEKYPGAVPYLKIVEGVKDQLLSGIEEPQVS